MNEKAGQHIGSGLAWMGFWLMIGLANFGEEPVITAIDATKEVINETITGEENEKTTTD